MNRVISGLLQDKIEERLTNNEQVILLQNRRGFSPVVRCKDCGEVVNVLIAMLLPVFI